jgi:hypothetical protein
MIINAAARLARKDLRRLAERLCFGSGSAVCIVFAGRSGIAIAESALFKRRLSDKSKIASYSRGRRDINLESNLGYARNTILYRRQIEGPMFDSQLTPRHFPIGRLLSQGLERFRPRQFQTFQCCPDRYTCSKFVV